MIVGNKKNQEEMMAFIPSMKSNMEEWQIISIKMPQRGKQYQDLISQELLRRYQEKDGMLFSVGDYKIVMVVRLGVISNYAVLKSEIESKMPKYDARVVARKMNAAGLKQIQSDLPNKDKDDSISLYEAREKRAENIFLIAEDDAFARKTLSSALKNYGKVYEVGDGAHVIDQYMKCNPDVVLMDIHMPNKNGLSLVDDVMEIDTDAFLVIASADSVVDNVVEAMSGGAVGFLAKPIKKDKMLEYLNQCITFNA